MKRALAILLLLVFLFNFTGIYVYFVLRLSEIRTEMRALVKKLPDNELVALSFTSQQWAAVHHADDDEIQWQGKMYDIARVKTHTSGVTVYAVHDEAEESLLTFLDTICKRASKDKKPVPAGMFHFFAACWFGERAMLINQYRSIAHQTFYRLSASELVVPIWSPPPQV